MVYHRGSVVFVDIQYVRGNNNQIFPKELVVLYANSLCPGQFLFKPPFPVNELTNYAVKQNNYCASTINGLNWSDGVAPYSEVENVLNTLKNFIIIVKGYEKQCFIQQYLKNSVIINFENCGSLKNLRNFVHNCYFHDGNYTHCAVLNVYKLLMHFEKESLLTD